MCLPSDIQIQLWFAPVIQVLHTYTGKCLALHQPFLSIPVSAETIKTIVTSLQKLQVCTVICQSRPRSFRSREFLLFPSHCVKLAHQGQSEWPRLVFRVRGGQGSWLYPGSDSLLPGKGWEGCVYLFSFSTDKNLRSLNYISRISEHRAHFQELIHSLSCKMANIIKDFGTPVPCR